MFTQIATVISHSTSTIFNTMFRSITAPLRPIRLCTIYANSLFVPCVVIGHGRDIRQWLFSALTVFDRYINPCGLRLPTGNGM